MGLLLPFLFFFGMILNPEVYCYSWSSKQENLGVQLGTIQQDKVDGYIIHGRWMKTVKRCMWEWGEGRG